MQLLSSLSSISKISFCIVEKIDWQIKKLICFFLSVFDKYVLSNVMTWQLGMIQYENDVTQLVFGYFKQSVKVGVDV